MMIKLNAAREGFVAAAREVLGDDVETISRPEVVSIASEHDVKYPSWLLNNKKLRVGRGVYWLPDLNGEYGGVHSHPIRDGFITDVESETPSTTDSIVNLSSTISIMDNQDNYVPDKFIGYVPYGNFNLVKQVIKSRIFYPMFITGLSGNGKTLMVKEVCARLKREYVRANITIETDEDDLIGGFRLINGETVWHNGPVIEALERGAILLLDEIDLARLGLVCPRGTRQRHDDTQNTNDTLQHGRRNESNLHKKVNLDDSSLNLACTNTNDLQAPLASLTP